jgi:hypothetical protein
MLEERRKVKFGSGKGNRERDLTKGYVQLRDGRMELEGVEKGRY